MSGDSDGRGAPAPLTPVTFHVLLSLAQRTAHGYQIKRMVEERTDGAVRLGAGTLYAGIGRMSEDGLIEETDTPDDLGDDVEPSSRWRFYTITAHGRDVLEAEIARLESDLDAARAIVPRPA
ncbi:MAG: PadR family transcriptional regulator [Gemmatimonadota bacterium]